MLFKKPQIDTHDTNVLSFHTFPKGLGKVFSNDIIGLSVFIPSGLGKVISNDIR